MKITPIRYNPKAISLSVERDAIRSPGIHLGAIIKDRLITAGIERKVKGGSKFTPEEQHLLFERGFLWERMVAEYIETNEWLCRQQDEHAGQHFSRALAETSERVLVRPGECQLDGIFMTPDALNMQEQAVEEWKATGLRAYNFDIHSRRPEWLWQVGAYTHIFGFRKSILRIWHVSDNVITQLNIDWEDGELAKNWADLMDHYSFMRERDARTSAGGPN
jgi:hypothetical protein